MGVAGEHDDGLYAVAADFVLKHFVGAFAAHLDQAVTLDDDELLPLAVVPVLALGDSWPGDVDAHLAAIRSMHQLGEGAAGVGVHLQVEGGLVLGQVAQIGGEQALGQAACGNFGNRQRLRQGGEAVEHIDYLAQGGLEGHRHVAVAAVLAADGFDALELAVVLAALQGENHLVDQVVDVEQFELDGGVVDPDGQPVGDVVAEGGHGGVVVGPAPLAEEVRETVDQNSGAGLAGIVEEELLAGLLALAVGVAGVAADEGGLDGAAEHNRAGVAVLLQGVEQDGGEAEVALAEIVGILGAVDAGEVEDEVGLAAVAVEVRRGRVKVVLEDLVDGHGIVLSLAGFCVIELSTKVFAYKTLGASN